MTLPAGTKPSWRRKLPASNAKRTRFWGEGDWNWLGRQTGSQWEWGMWAEEEILDKKSIGV